MRLDNKKRRLNSSIFVKKIIICYIAVFLLVELLFVNVFVYTASSETILDLQNMHNDTMSDKSTEDKMLSDTSDESSNPEEESDTSIIDEPTNDDTNTETNIDTTKIDNNQDSAIDDETSIDNSQENTVNNVTNIDSLLNDLNSDDSNLVDVIQNERVVQEEEIASIIQNELGNLLINEEIELTTDNTTSIDKIKFIPATNLNDVKVSVINLKNKPEEITKPIIDNNSIYNYLDIKLTTNNYYVQESEINKLEFTFKVEQNWIEDNNIDKFTIILMRYHDSKWQNLNTTLINEDGNYLFYESISTGCSTFAIVGSKVVEKQESYKTDDMDIPWSIIFLIVIFLIVVLVAILFKARYIYIR